jgi:hypothetical protein
MGKLLDALASLSSAIVIFVLVGLFAYFFYDEFMAVSQFFDDTRCSIGADTYCAN